MIGQPVIGNVVNGNRSIFHIFFSSEKQNTIAHMLSCREENNDQIERSRDMNIEREKVN